MLLLETFALLQNAIPEVFVCVRAQEGVSVCTFVCVQICLMLPKLDSNTLTTEFKVMLNHFSADESLFSELYVSLKRFLKKRG